MSEKKRLNISVFFPFWNEEKNIVAVVNNALPIIKETAGKWEILMIDDGSTDATAAKALDIEKKNPHTKLIQHQINRGYGAALRTGFSIAQYDYVVFTDGDRQFDFAEITRFIDKIADADIVIGYRKKRDDSFARYVLMMLHRIWSFVFFGVFVKDIDCGFKLFRKSALEEISPLRSEGAIITTEILAKAKSKELKIAQVEVSHYSRKYGVSSGSNIGVVIRAMLETFILVWDIRNKRF